MRIQQVIKAVTDYCGKEYPLGTPISAADTRDRVLYGSAERECTGIVTCIYASPEVIEEAGRRGANLIIAHEALFWNRGDHTEWLADDPVFQAKRALLDRGDMTVWRCHDCLHAGIPTGPEGALEDGIFWGTAWKLGWLDYHQGTGFFPGVFDIPETTLGELARWVAERLGLRGAKVVGDLSAPVRRVRFMGHAYGIGEDDPLIESNAELDIDCELALEVVDYTIAEYVRDASALGMGKGLISVGHFDLEEPGMEYLATWLPGVLRAALPDEDIPRIGYVQAGGFASYVAR